MFFVGRNALLCQTAELMPGLALYVLCENKQDRQKVRDEKLCFICILYTGIDVEIELLPKVTQCRPRKLPPHLISISCLIPISYFSVVYLMFPQTK